MIPVVVRASMTMLPARNSQALTLSLRARLRPPAYGRRYERPASSSMRPSAPLGGTPLPSPAPRLPPPRSDPSVASTASPDGRPGGRDPALEAIARGKCGSQKIWWDDRRHGSDHGHPARRSTGSRTAARGGSTGGPTGYHPDADYHARVAYRQPDNRALELEAGGGRRWDPHRTGRRRCRGG